jgi:pimeloyl-ACP methyl ester carboxylesterase
VVLHGFLEQGASWDLVAPLLGRRVLAPDHRGHGLSGHVGSGGFYHFWNYVPDVVHLIETLGEPVDLVGHSMGGAIGVYLASLRPDLVRRFVLYEGLGLPDASGAHLDRSKRFLAHRANPPRHRLVQGIADGVARLRRWNSDLPEPLALKLATRITRPLRPGDVYEGEAGPDSHMWTWDPLHRSRNPNPFREQVFLDHLAQIEAPVLYVQGGKSYYRLPNTAQRLAVLRDVRSVTVPEGSHMMHHAMPDVLTELIREHLEG